MTHRLARSLITQSNDWRENRVEFDAPKSLVERVDNVAEVLDIPRTQLLIDAIENKLDELANEETFRRRLSDAYYDGRTDYDTIETIPRSTNVGTALPAHPSSPTPRATGETPLSAVRSHRRRLPRIDERRGDTREGRSVQAGVLLLARRQRSTSGSPYCWSLPVPSSSDRTAGICVRSVPASRSETFSSNGKFSGTTSVGTA
jgi:hypothetical protein